MVIAGVASGAGTRPLIVFALVTYVLFRLRLWTAIPVYSTLMTLVATQSLWAARTAPERLVSDSAGVLVANLLGMIAGYSLEQTARRSFLLSSLLEAERQKSERLLEWLCFPDSPSRAGHSVMESTEMNRSTVRRVRRAARNLPARADYYRPRRARELRRKAVLLDRWFAGLLALFFLVCIGGVKLAGLAGAGAAAGWVLTAVCGALCIPGLSHLWRQSDQHRAEAHTLEREHQARYGRWAGRIR